MQPANMAQTILSVVAEVQPESADLVRKRLAALTSEHETKANPEDQSYDRLRSAVPALHFMSMTVADDEQYNPIFVLEANFDGEPGPFWAQLEAAIGPSLRDVLCLCKPPRDDRLGLFNSVTLPNSRAPLAPLLEALTVRPVVAHQGNRGLDRARIIHEGKLFSALRQAVDRTPLLHSMSAVEVHRQLRAKLLPEFPWLDEPVASRIGTLESLIDHLRLCGFYWFFILAFLGLGWVLTVFYQSLHPALTVYKSAPLAGISLLAGLAAMRWRLRWLEQRDATNDAPFLDANKLREMVRREDFIAQNHMISIVHLKPGVLRAILAQLILSGLGLRLRVRARDGYLSSMRTIHFAHWAVLNNGGRLMFQSNFDGSWESYLDDFIEKAHEGLTLAWTHCVGFPPTRCLFKGGAADGRKFKAWARHSMYPSQFWFSAYKEYSVNQIERQARLADGLRQPVLKDQEARAWVIDL